MNGHWYLPRALEGTKKIGLETIELCSALEFRDEKDHLCLCYLSVVDWSASAALDFLKCRIAEPCLYISQPESAFWQHAWWFLLCWGNQDPEEWQTEPSQLWPKDGGILSTRLGEEPRLAGTRVRPSHKEAWKEQLCHRKCCQAVPGKSLQTQRAPSWEEMMWLFQVPSQCFGSSWDSKINQ